MCFCPKYFQKKRISETKEKKRKSEKDEKKKKERNFGQDKEKNSKALFRWCFVDLELKLFEGPKLYI